MRTEQEVRERLRETVAHLIQLKVEGGSDLALEHVRGQCDSLEWWLEIRDNDGLRRVTD